MKINKIHIENFGRLSNFDLDLNDGLNEIHKENGFGKTTLSIFLKAMFYGMPASRDNLKMERKKYVPWKGGRFGGYVEFSCLKGNFRLTRFFDRTPEGDKCELLDLSSNQLMDIGNSEFGEQLFNIGKETFETTAFFPQNKFESSANNQISANILGLDKLKFDIANVKLAVEKIKKKESEIKKLKPNKTDITRLKSRLSSLNNELVQLESSLKTIQKNKEDLIKEYKTSEENFKVLQQQFLLQEELFATKENIEKEIMILSAKLNELYQKQEKINLFRQNLSEKEPQKNKKTNLYLIVGGSLLLLVPILLAVFSIIKPLVVGIVCAGIILLFVLLYFSLNKKTPKDSEIINEKQRLDDEYQNNTKQISQTIDSIKQAETRLDSYKNITRNSNLYDEAKDKLAQFKFNIQRNEIQEDNLNKDIDRLVEDIEEAKDSIVLLEQSEKDITKKLELLKQTREFLSLAHQNVSKRFIEPVQSSMGIFLKEFNLQDRQFIVDTNLDIKQLTEDGVKELDYSSQGIKDILYFCMRIYFIGQIYKQEKPFIILDDTFVNLDDINMEKAKEIVEKLSKEYQIIYTYCHERCKIKNS